MYLRYRKSANKRSRLIRCFLAGICCFGDARQTLLISNSIMRETGSLRLEAPCVHGKTDCSGGTGDGFVGIGADGNKHPTSAGLLMFGNEYDIVREYNTYFLDYQEQYDAATRWTDRVISSSGDWSGNVYDFYFRVYNKLT